jgi:hypothetical protein
MKERDEAEEGRVRRVAVAAVDDSRLLEGEDPSTEDPEAARRWVAIYSELQVFKRDVASRMRAKHEELPGPARVEVMRDLQLVESQMARLQRRLSFWRARQLRLGGIPPEHNGLELGFGETSVRLSRREAQLLSFLAQNPGRIFSSKALATRAWHDPTLSAAQVRNYLSRVRHKLQFVLAPCRIETVDRRGYCLEWTNPELA